ncbi:MAG: NFACT RNA binding domain-containing protein, partial [Bacteroidia bacterium]
RADSYKEKADLLMANMWQIEKRQKEVCLTSFDGSREVSIKLKDNLSPQLNAERYYRKAKNESKQREFAMKHLADLQDKEYAKIEEIAEFDALESFKAIKKIAAATENKLQIKRPYREISVDGFEIRVGKGAKENDELLRNHSSKTDLWFHAKDVSGSHVLLRNPGKKQLLASTLEKVAGIAAYYSRAKNDTLAAVIYTDRKYIRKPKGANPGMVKVDKEKVILVEPINPSH